MSRSFLLFGFILYSVFLSSLANASDIDLSAPMDKGGWKLIWSEEFDYTGFPDSTKWSYDTEGNVYQWGNNEAQYYTSGRKENAWVSDGVLRITALKEPMEGRSYTSARLITKGKGDWLYGRFEIRAKLPTGRGTWPAIWMLPTDWEYGDWPKSGEIDIMENKGYQPNIVSSALHFPGHSGGNPITQTFGYENQRFDTDFHIFAVEWDESQIDFFVDNVLYKRVKAADVTDGEWVFDHPFFIILNVAVGGTFGGDPTADTVFPQSMYVDYVRVYQKSTEVQPGTNTGDISSNGSIPGWDFNGPDSDKGLIEPELK